MTFASLMSMQPPPVPLMLWKYLPVTSSDRLGQQIGVWMNHCVAVAPLSASSAFVFGIGPTPLCQGKEPPSF